MKLLRPLLSLLFIFLIFFMSFFSKNVLAAVFWPPDPSGDVQIETQSGLKNVFTLGRTVRIQADKISKDLFVMGADVSLFSHVENNVFALGEYVRINGSIGGNLFAVAKEIHISGTIDGDLFALGAEIHLKEGSVINGEIFAASGIFSLKGEVFDNVTVKSNETILDGIVLGHIQLTADQSVKVGNSAILQKLSYRSPVEAEISAGAEIREMDYTPIVSSSEKTEELVSWTKYAKGFGVIDWMASIVLGFILLFLLRNHTVRVLDITYKKFGLSVAFGLSFFVAVPIALILMLVFVVGYKLAFASGVFSLFIGSISSVLAGLFVGALIQHWIKKPRQEISFFANWISVILGITVFRLLLLLPIIGWLTRFVLVCAVIGAMLSYFFQSLEIRDKPYDQKE